jgi:hypothetical protein
MIESISAITLATHDMSRAVRFYRMLGETWIAESGTDRIRLIRHAVRTN